MQSSDPNVGAAVDASSAITGGHSTDDVAVDIRVVQWEVSPQAPSDALIATSERETRASGLVSVTVADASAA